MGINDGMWAAPYNLFDVECGKGWEKLYKPLFDYIEGYNKDKVREEDKIHVLQCKEKFGALRFYTNFETEELSKMVEEAEDRSHDVCECCGSEEYVGHTNDHYITTRCIDCLGRLPWLRHGVNWVSHKDGNGYAVNAENFDEIKKIIKKR